MSNLRHQIWAVVPVKAFAQAKSRLSPELSPASREGLARAMLADVLSALTQSRAIGQTLVITADPEVMTLAQSLGAQVLRDRLCTGQTAAVEQAARALDLQQCTAMLTLPGDLPLLTGADIDAICQPLCADRPLVFAPAINDGGTNALLCAPPLGMRFHFGEDSFAKHQRAARELGLGFTVSQAPGFRLDLDRPSDLDDFLTIESDTHAYSFLRAFQPEHICGGSFG
ncbi:MAG: 2-phospho-L-lactate guanylyltransferase [Burkholderiales bacterium]|nr:2-phospho-L-lactate guanylyltransferase [Burkholderiales bacterium]